jgi:hypothetical protein
VLDHGSTDEVNLEEAGRHRDRQGVRPAGERDRYACKYGLLARRVLVELG